MHEKYVIFSDMLLEFYISQGNHSPQDHNLKTYIVHSNKQ